MLNLSAGTCQIVEEGKFELEQTIVLILFRISRYLVCRPKGMGEIKQFFSNDGKCGQGARALYGSYHQELALFHNKEKPPEVFLREGNEQGLIAPCVLR